MENSQELIGILQAISIVAKSLAVKLMKIDREIRAYESAGEGTRGRKRTYLRFSHAASFLPLQVQRHGIHAIIFHA